MGEKNSVLTTGEFSKLTGIPTSTVAKMVRKGKLVGEKVGGKWMIPRDQLTAGAVQARAAKNIPPAVAGQSATAKKSQPSGGYCSIAQFCERTYLTEAGIEQWLKSGRLQGRKGADGHWQVDRQNLDAPHLRHLIRR